MKLKYLFALVITVLMIVACQSNEEQRRNLYVCDFIKERNNIKVNYEYKYDIIPYATFGFKTASKSGVGVEMKLFNYGGKLRINESAIENIYSSNFAPISHFYVVSSENITIANVFDDKTYGKWATGRVIVPEFNRYFEDVFISPLAYKYLKEEQNNDNDCLVLVRLISTRNKCTYNGVFYGDYLIKWIINTNYQQIIINHDVTFNINNIGGFWKPLYTDEELKIYKEYQQKSVMNLLKGSNKQYKLPETISNKTAR